MSYVWKSWALSTNLKIRENKLQCDSLFDEIWSELFNKRHALVPDGIIVAKVAIAHRDVARDVIRRSTPQRQSVVAQVAE